MTHSLKDAINLHRQKAEWEEMIPLAQEILSKDPGDSPALRSLAEAYDRTDQTEKTIEIWRILVDRHHEITPFARRLGLALKAKGDSAARTYLEQALTVAIDRKVMSEVEEIWLELMELPTLRPSFFLDYAARLAGRREKQRAGELLLIYVESASLEPTDRLACFRAVVDYLPDRQSEFREPLVEAFRAVYSNRPDLSKLIDLSNITFAESLPEAVIQLDRYLKFGEGQYFYHNGWGAGKIRRIDPGQQRVYIDFAKKKEHMLTLEMADKSLTPIPAGDLRAMWLEDEDKVRELARQNPVALVKSALISLGGKANAKELKDALLNCPISEVDWQKWWTAFNKKIKDDHFVEVTGASLKTYTLRDEPEGPDDEYARRFRECRTLRGRLDILGDYRGHLGDSCRPDLLNQMAHDLVSKASITKSDSEAAETVFVIHDLSSASSVKQEHLDQILFPILHSLDRAVGALEGLKSVQLQSRFFALMEEHLKNQLAEAYERLLFDGPDSIRDLVAEHVAKTHEEDVLPSLFRKVRGVYRDEPGLFVWFARRLLNSRESAEAAGITRPTLIEHLIGLHEVLGYRVRTSKKDNSAPLRANMADIRQILKRSGFKRLREILTETDATEARHLWKAADHAVGIEDRLRKEITGYLLAHFPEIQSGGEESRSAEASPTPPPSRLLCLLESLEAKREQLKRLKEVEIPQNSREIESARALGDLRENAEYHAAKERQGVLLALVGQLQEEIARATAIREEDFATDSVGFGSRVQIRFGDKERSVAILGPWESDPDEDVLSYESPLGKTLWGHGVGETLEAPAHGSMVPVIILGIEAYSGHPALVGQ